jgi:hypothetical protein
LDAVTVKRSLSWFLAGILLTALAVYLYNSVLGGVRRSVLKRDAGDIMAIAAALETHHRVNGRFPAGSGSLSRDACPEVAATISQLGEKLAYFSDGSTYTLLLRYPGASSAAGFEVQNAKWVSWPAELQWPAGSPPALAQQAGVQ